MNSRFYVTKQKTQIVEMLKKNSDRHMNVDDMLFLLNAQKCKVSRATLYRYLDVLVSTGDVRKFITGDKACYQYVSDDNDNDEFHLMCVECGKLIHMKCHKVADIMEHVETAHHFKVDPTKVVLYGICEDCAKLIEKEKEEKGTDNL